MNSRVKSFRLRNWVRLAVLLAGICGSALRAEVRLPKIFSEHMVLQQGKPIQVWGWAAAGETVTVQIGGSKVSTIANAKGEWKVTVPAMKTGAPLQLVVSGANTLTIDDVLIGEVWLCSGQSNMEMGIAQSEGAEPAIAAANRPQLRLLSVPKRWTPLAQTDIEATWRVCSPESVKNGGWGGFSACAYYFGRQLNEELGVPVGLIDATWGGTSIQSWTPPEGFAAVPALKRESDLVRLGDPRTPEHAARLEEFITETEQWLALTRSAMTQRTVGPSMPVFPDELRPPGQLQAATALFNGMIHPLCPYTIAGAIWYQGENNLNDGGGYGDRMQALIKGWRQIWGQGEFPFDYVQIAPFDYGDRPEAEAELWEAQASALSITNTGMAVINDIANLRDIHPKNKKTVGERLARIALARTYGRNQLEYSGPTFNSLTIEGDKLRVKFDHADGLASRDGKPLTWFEVLDAEHGGYVQAEARIENNAIVLSSAEASHPVAMRFAWSMLAEPNLMNSAGLPAGSFRAGKVPDRDSLEMNIPEARDYELVYDLDLARAGRKPNYDQDRHEAIKRPFDRVAYFLELQPVNGQPQFVYVSMKAFTEDLKKIGVPTAASGAHFQQRIAEMNVYSNVRAVKAGQGIATGNLEFWPGNYGPDNAANVPGASSQTLDFGDSTSGDADGYGSMQVHNYEERQTIFAFNHWSEGANADVGIGNNPSGNPDWTFAGNSKSYSKKRLRVLVRCLPAK